MQLTEQEKTRLAESQVDAQIGFYIHGAIYVLVIAMLVGINYQSGQPWWAQWPALGWGVGVIGHALAVFGRTPRAIAQWRLRRIQQIREQIKQDTSPAS